MTGLEHRRRNQELIAERLRWPAGMLETCRRIEDEHPGWLVSWTPANDWAGHGDGFTALHPDANLPDGDETRPGPKDWVLRHPRVFGETPEALAVRIGAVMERVAAQAECRERAWRAMRPGS